MRSFSHILLDNLNIMLPLKIVPFDVHHILNCKPSWLHLFVLLYWVISNTEEIYTALLTPPGESEDHYQELKPTPSNLQTPVRVIVQKIEQKYSNNEAAVSLASLNSNDIKSSNYLTMTGTIKRGRYPEKNIDIQLSVTPDHLSKLEKRVQLKYHDRCFCGLRRGPHVFLISLLSIPFMLIYSAFQG